MTPTRVGEKVRAHAGPQGGGLHCGARGKTRVHALIFTYLLFHYDNFLKYEFLFLVGVKVADGLHYIFLSNNCVLIKDYS